MNKLRWSGGAALGLFVGAAAFFHYRSHENQGQKPEKLVVDGEFGPLTAAALQRALNKHGAGLTVDGEFGNRSIRALQKYLGVEVDGQIGPVTIKALQRKVGATADGVWGPLTTKALQRALNAGSF